MFIENDISKNVELNRIFQRFNKMRMYHNRGYMNILPTKYLQKNPRQYRQIQINTDKYFNAIIMDIDDEELVVEWDSVGLPVPTIQTLNKNNNKAHLIWLLKVPVYKKNKKAVAYYKAIVESIRILIGADPAYQNHQTKNFLNDDLYRVRYNDVAYDLDDFREYIIQDHKIASSCGMNLESTGSRHIDLFNQLRFYGYQIARSKDLADLLQTRAEIINSQFNVPINPKSIIKSVLTFCEENKYRFRTRQATSVMGFSKISGLTKEEFRREVSIRQKKAALRTASIRHWKTRTAIKKAVDQLRRKRLQVTYKSLAKYTGRSESTVRRYSHFIKKLTVAPFDFHSLFKGRASVGEERATCIPLRSYFGVRTNDHAVILIEEKDP